MTIGCIVCAFLLLIGQGMDMSITARGLKAGIAIERSGFTRWFMARLGIWPGLIVKEAIEFTALILPAVLPLPLGDGGIKVFPMLSCAAMGAMALKHYQSARKWQWMFHHPGQKLPEMTSWWRKFLGFWG